MTVTGVRATFALYGRLLGATAEQVTGVLRIQPTRSHEQGALRTSRSPRLDGTHWVTSAWIFEEPATIATGDDAHGTASLDRLAERFAPLSEVLSELAVDYDIRVLVAADSDSTQGGFVIGADTMRLLGTLGASLVGEVWLEEPGAAG